MMEVVFNGDRSLKVAVTENGDAHREAFVADLFSPGGLAIPDQAKAIAKNEAITAAPDLSPERVAQFIKGVRGLKVVETSLA